MTRTSSHDPYPCKQEAGKILTTHTLRLQGTATYSLHQQTRALGPGSCPPPPEVGSVSPLLGPLPPRWGPAPHPLATSQGPCSSTFALLDAKDASCLPEAADRWAARCPSLRTTAERVGTPGTFQGAQGPQRAGRGTVAHAVGATAFEVVCHTASGNETRNSTLIPRAAAPGGQSSGPSLGHRR